MFIIMTTHQNVFIFTVTKLRRYLTRHAHLNQQHPIKATIVTSLILGKATIVAFSTKSVKMLLTYYCNTQKQSSAKLAKFVGKQLCRSLFFSKVASRSKKRFRHSFFKNTSGKLLWILSFFWISSLQVFQK